MVANPLLYSFRLKPLARCWRLQQWPHRDEGRSAFVHLGQVLGQRILEVGPRGDQVVARLTEHGEETLGLQEATQVHLEALAVTSSDQSYHCALLGTRIFQQVAPITVMEKKLLCQ